MSVDAERHLMTGLGRELAALFPVAASHRGWTIANLSHEFEQAPWGVEETWSCDIIGPRDLYSERKRFTGGASQWVWQIGASAIGSAYSTTPEGLIEQVRLITEALGIRDLTEPA